MSNIDKRALRERAESTIGILENISGFEPSDIDGDTVELRFETEDGFDTGCDVSIVDQCQKAADVVRALLDELEAKDKRIAELEAREINLPPYSFFDFKQGSPFKSGAYCHIDSVNQELSKHGIKMTAAAGKGE